MIIIELINCFEKAFCNCRRPFFMATYAGRLHLDSSSKTRSKNLSGLDPTPGTIGITLSL